MNCGREEPYLHLRLHALYLETAIMQYGSAIQFGVGSVLLVDKTNAGVTGSYLELISTEEPYEVLVVSFRKVLYRRIRIFLSVFYFSNICVYIHFLGQIELS